MRILSFRRRTLLSAMIGLTTAAHARAAAPTFGDRAALTEMPPATGNLYPPDEEAFIRAAIKNSAALLGATQANSADAWKQFFTDAPQRAARGWVGRLIAVRATMEGLAPTILLWPGLVIRTEQQTQFGKQPETFIIATDPLYRAVLPLPVGTPVLFDALVKSASIDGDGPYPYPIAIIGQFTVISQLPEGYNARQPANPKQ